MIESILIFCLSSYLYFFYSFNCLFPQTVYSIRLYICVIRVICGLFPAAFLSHGFHRFPQILLSVGVSLSYQAMSLHISVICVICGLINFLNSFVPRISQISSDFFYPQADIVLSSDELAYLCHLCHLWAIISCVFLSH